MDCDKASLSEPEETAAFKDWLDFENFKPDECQRCLVIRTWVDAEWDWEKGGYANDKPFWTEPEIGVDIYNGYTLGWHKSAKVLYWMPLPQFPSDDEIKAKLEKL